MAKIGIATDKDYIELYEQYCENFRNSTPINTNEKPAERIKRIAMLEANPEKWFKYYFPNYCTAEPASFHKAATKRLLSNAEWFEVRAWSRELAKSARSMMEITYLALTGKITNLLLVSNSADNAILLLAPFKAFFESNQRVAQDYGNQMKYGHWTDENFTIKKGCSFRAIGTGQSPRGTRNNEKRPDFILIDDFDTDKDCRNEDIMKEKVNWMEQALIPTRSVSNPTRILVNGNIIHNNCMVKYLGDKNTCDKFDVVNIRDKNGKSSWPEKNSEADIDRVLSTISYESGQKEYFNNPMDGGTVFKELIEGRVPAYRETTGIIYADPATSNKDSSNASYKAIGLILYKNGKFYIAKTKVDTMSTTHFVEALYDMYEYAMRCGPIEDLKVYIENNSLQNPFYEQAMLPLIHEIGKQRNQYFLPVIPDERKKGDKYTRIEGLLEPLHRAGKLIFNERERNDPDMKRLQAQFLNLSPKQKRIDGPDMVEGGVFLLKQRIEVVSSEGIYSIKRRNTKKL
jgi:hypothetical protein